MRGIVLFLSRCPHSLLFFFIVAAKSFDTRALRRETGEARKGFVAGGNAAGRAAWVTDELARFGNADISTAIGSSGSGTLLGDSTLERL
jgi:ferric-dicitrate binding protein FerR (iron transport regulator)